MEISNNNNGGGFSRRDLLKGLASIPILGAIGFGTWSKRDYDSDRRREIIRELNLTLEGPPPPKSLSGDPIRLGIIGFGIRGEQLVRACGFATSEWKNKMLEGAMKNKNDDRYRTFADQDNLNVVITGVCDLFDPRAEAAIDASGGKAKRYRHYQEMLQSPDIDAVIVATPDHWHAQMSIDAAKAGKHVYVEKCMTRTLAEADQMRLEIPPTGVVFAVGHQHRQTESFIMAREVIRKNVLGPISLIQTNTNRNTGNGAWQYDIDPRANPETIDWKQFLGNAPDIPFDAERFFRWRKWWDYGTGLSGDLLTHEFDSINTIIEMGIPKSVVASGGVYFHKDGREVPDVFQVVMEYPNRNMTFMYTASLANQYNRTNLIMGHDASMEMGAEMVIKADVHSSRYEDKIKAGLIKPGEPMYAYQPGAKGVEGVTSATTKYFAGKGLLFTYRNGKKVDSTHLHIREWLECIRHGGEPSCGMKEGYEEAVAAHMATISYKTGRKVIWDHQNSCIANMNDLIGYEELIRA